MTDLLFPNLDEYRAGREAESAHSYDQKMLKCVYLALYDEERYRADRAEAGEEFGLNWFNDTVGLGLPLFASKHSISADVLLRPGLTKTPLWQDFFEHLAETPNKSAAMFFQVAGLSGWVMHNANLVHPPTYPFIARPAKSIDRMLVFISREAFLIALKEFAGAGV